MKQLTRRGFLGTSLAAGGALAARGDDVNERKRPNILLLFSDQHHAGVLGCAGHPDVRTPALDELARQGVRYDRAYCQDGVSAPSRSSMLTGHYPRTTGVVYNPDNPPHPEQFTTLQDHLKEHGYRTAAFGKRHLPRAFDGGFDVTCTALPEKFDPSDENYWDWIEARGELEAFERDWNAEFGHRFKPSRAAEMCCRESELRPESTMEAYTAMRTMEYLRDAGRSGSPFFCWCSFYRPHQPYTPLPQYTAQYPPDGVALPGSIHEPPENLPPLLEKYRGNENKPWCLGLAAKDESLYRRYIAYYYALVAEIDHHIGAILRTLEEEGLADNTIVIYTSDHGDFVGHHGMIEKIHNGHNIYEDTLRVPFIVRAPGAKRGAVHDDLVELTDLYPTLLELGGLPAPAGLPLPGRSLAANLRSGAPVGREVAFSENYVMLTAIGADHKLGAWIEPPENGFPDMLFSRTQDPLEMHNLAGTASAAEAESRLREAMGAFCAGTPNMTGKPMAPPRA